ncbi:uncharacterized protein LOC142618342 [Castanea sativa]|uniref:uncharacterized protein LOC142618342 n=1 Tax=Castanea sativa TaxID=21020 RepID=UPI003F64DDD9
MKNLPPTAQVAYQQGNYLAECFNRMEQCEKNPEGPLRFRESGRHRFHPFRLAGTAVSRKAGASTLSQLMVVKKTFPTTNAWIASSRESIQMLLKHSSVNISENPVLVLLEATGRDTPI